MSCTITTLDEDDSSVRRIWAVVVQDRNRYALLSSAQLDRGLQQEYLRKLGSSAVDELQARLALDQASAAFLLGTPVDRSLLDFSNASTNRFMLRCGKRGREDESLRTIKLSRLRTSGTHWRSLYDIQFTLSAGQLGVFDGGDRCARVPCPGKYPGVPVPGPMSILREERDTQGFIAVNATGSHCIPS